jgi:MFS transporter, ACS family, tartrate transporter
MRHMREGINVSEVSEEQADVFIGRTAIRRVTRRIIPFVFLMYVTAWLDRVNVGFAGLHMNADLGFSASIFGFGSGIFFLGYCLLEVPSNLILHRVGARLWLARIMVTWGVLSSAMMLVRTPLSFYTLRFLLGAAEAGFFPGVLYYLSEWYPQEHRARAISAFMTAIPVTGLVGGPMSAALLRLSGWHGLAGWQWLFLMEGVPAVLLGTVAFFYLTDRPEDARWLPPEERRWLVGVLAAERNTCRDGHRVTTRAALMHPTVWWLGSLFLLAVIGFYGYSMWSPLVIRSLTGGTDMQIGIITAGISAVTILAMLGNSAHSDKADERPLHVAIPLTIQAAGFLGCALLPTPLLRMLSLALVPLGHGAAYGPFWSMPTRFLSGEAAAGGLAVVATIVSVGGFIGPLLIGLLKEHTGSYAPALVVLSVAAMISAIMAVRLRSSQTLNARSPNS